MTKDQIAKPINEANTALVFAMLSSWFPILALPGLSTIVKYFLGKKLYPISAEGVVYVAFATIDAEQVAKGKAAVDAVVNLNKALAEGVSHEIAEASENFDDAFLDAIRIKPKP